ncbi:acetyl-CoA acetyltransferase [Antarctobacter sp.]|uniref:acetyl-CoA acetyltransferase n=1 Tax=Antarctobacter sp. TaxID=1872577 RepID=UPI002B268A6E|nr:acetyl-CoA acetyltransferase [Antarctobacter sp.]
MSNQPCVIGWAHSKFGNLADSPDTESLIKATVPAALDDAGITAADVDGIFLGTFNSGFVTQSFEAGLVGMAVPELAHVPASRLENACATGSAALYSALDFVQSGRGKIALVVGVEKMTTIPPAEAAALMLRGSYYAEEGHFSPGFAGVFGHIAQSYFQAFGDQSDALAMISAKNHHNAMKNPVAHMHKDLGYAFCNTVSDKNPVVAGPLRRSDCSLISDGAAVMVVCDAETAEGMGKAVQFRAHHHANDFMALSRRPAPYSFGGAARAWKGALDEASITLDDLDLVETHDCFTIAEMLEYEAMGLAEPGQGHRVIREGVTQADGRLPVNLSGGLKARGHPLGATGVSMHVMAAMQLTGEAGEMQKDGAALAGVFNMGGAAVANYTSILERVK